MQGNPRIIETLNDVLTAELTAINQYFIHAKMCDNWGYDRLAVHIKDDCVLDPVKCYVDTPKLGLVGRMHGRGWYARTTDRFEVPRMTVAEWEAKKKAAE